MTTKNLSKAHFKADTICCGTDEDVDTPCSPCFQDDEKRIESVVFCLECSEHLCISCRNYHRKLKLTHGHHLLEIKPRNGVVTGNNSMTESCPEHPGRCIEYFCEADQLLCCKSCREVSHKGCEGVRYIPEEAMGVKESDAIANTDKSLRAIREQFESQIQKKKTQAIHMSDQMTVALIQIKTERTSAIELVNKLADEAEQDVKDKSKIITDQLESEIETYISIRETLNVTDNCLKTVSCKAGEPQIYITVKKAEQQLEKYSSYVDELESTMADIKFKFVLSSTFHSIPKKLTTMGTFVEETLDKDSSLRRNDSFMSVSSLTSACSRMSLATRRKKAIPVGGQSVRIPGDKTTCYITGIEFLESGKLVLADYNNRSVKLFSQNCSYITNVVLTSRPNDIVVTGETELATSLIDENVIQFINVNILLSLSRRINTAYPYVGLAYSKRSELYGSTTFEDGRGEIHIMDMRGNILRCITTGPDESALIRPTTIRLNDEDTLLYANDLGRNCVVCLDISDETKTQYRPIFTYTDRNLELRSGLTIDREGNVYVSSGNMTVHQISANGTKVHEILTSTDGLGLPHCLAFSASDNHLLVSEFKENSVKLFYLR